MNLFHGGLALGMLVTGSVNTITTKAADEQVALDAYGNKTSFNSPFLQACFMFGGELLCLFAFYILVWRAKLKKVTMERAKPFNPLVFILPALCDMTATSTMYLGLALTDASVFQMLRGSVIIFTSALSVIFLKRKLYKFHWLGILLVIGGTAIVGTQSNVCPATTTGDTCGVTTSGPSLSTIGNILIIVAQLIVAVQMVVEEKLISGLNMPALEVVGLEGMWGLSILSLVVIGLYHVKPPSFLIPPCMTVNGVSVPTPPEYTQHFEDSLSAFTQMRNNPAIIAALVGNMISIAFFNAFGVSVTKYMNASTRMVLDSLRTIVIWAVSLGAKWESFCWIQILGFVVLLAGTIIYNAVVRVPYFAYPEESKAPDAVAAAIVADDESAQAGLLANAAEAGAINGGRGSDAGLQIAEYTPQLRKAIDFKKR